MIKIGITGGVGSGKTRVLEYLGAHTKSRILLADEVAHQVKEPNSECYRQLVCLLGTSVLEENGRIHRGKMAEVIFGDKKLLRQVNEIIHPAVKEYILKAMEKEEREKKTEVFFLEAALLIESGYLSYLDELWYIYSDIKTREKRLQESKQYSLEKIRQIVEQQLPEEEFLKYAGVVIDNSREFADTCRQLEKEGRRLHIWQEQG